MVGVNSHLFFLRLAEQSRLLMTPNTLKSAELFDSAHVGAINSLAIDQQYGRYMLSGGADSSIRLWDLQDGEPDTPAGAIRKRSRQNRSKKPSSSSSLSLVAEVPRKTQHRFGISAIQWYPRDAGLFVSSSFDHFVKVWDAEALEVVYAFDLQYRVYSADVSPNPASHALVATATDHPLVRLLDLRTSSASHTLKGHHLGSVQAVKWAPDKPHLVASGGSDGTVRIWDIRQSNACLDILDVFRTSSSAPLANKSLSSKIFSHKGTVNSLLWLPDSKHLLSAGTDDEIRLWSIPEYQSASPSEAPRKAHNTLLNYGRFVSNHFPQTLYMCTTQDDARFFFPSDSGQILLFDVHSGKLVERLDRPEQPGSMAADVPRSTCITPRGHLDERQPAQTEYFSGALDGTITSWVFDNPGYESSEAGEEDPAGAGSESSDSEDDYESAGAALKRLKK